MAPMSTAFATDFVLDAGWCLALELSFAPASVPHLHCWSGFALLRLRRPSTFVTGGALRF